MKNEFLPISKKDLDGRGWESLDVILVTGDAYVDHPSYGSAVIGRVLEDRGFRVGIIAQPDCKNTADFKKLGRPKLFFGVTAGNLDSMVANYTANKKLRNVDEYSPGGKAGLRPDRTSIVYTNKIREAFPGAIVVLGGMEASLRRLAHYDYWQDSVRRSILLDAKADILIFGMGETQIAQIADRLKAHTTKDSLSGIRGTVIAQNSINMLKDYVELPSYEDVAGNKDRFNAAFRMIYDEADPVRGRTLVQRHGDRFVIQFPPAMPIPETDLDHIYELNYMRRPHPIYEKSGGVPGFESVKSSLISHRGCPGACSFCSLYLHQGAIVQSRSPESIISEIKKISCEKDFRGTITDIGGPTANLYGAECEMWAKVGCCKARNCLAPQKCNNLKMGYEKIMKLLAAAGKLEKVRHIFIGSGVRCDTLVDEASRTFLKCLCRDHVSGYLKAAPEHSEEDVLKLMNKPSFETYKKFRKNFEETNRNLKKEQYLVNYFISAHPGSTLESALNLSLTLQGLGIYPEQIQDFLPLPMTVSGAMYYTEKDPFTGRTLYVAKGLRERKLQRALVQYKNPVNKRYVIEALQRLGKRDLLKKFFK